MNEEQQWDFLLGEIKEMKTDLKELRNEMQTLKVKVALFSSLFASVVTAVISKLMS
jgi:hypothetical protein